MSTTYLAFTLLQVASHYSHMALLTMHVVQIFAIKLCYKAHLCPLVFLAI